LALKGIEDGHRQTIVEELFLKCDIDNSGRIELNEFVEHYLGTKVQLQMRERELR
jgi:Ca2+-binding EF-hand superfamily protein